MRTPWKILSLLAIGAPGILSATAALAEEEFSWSGFYIGLDGGYGWTEPDAVSFSAAPSGPFTNFGNSIAPSRGTIGNLEADSWFAGGQIGINGQKGHILMGMEGDLQAADFHDTQAGIFTNPNGAFPIAGDASLDVNWFGTVRGRLGLAMNRVLIYGTGGLAFADVDYRLAATETGAGALYQTRLHSDELEGGFTVGGGVELGITRNFSLKGEYQFLDFDVEDSSPVTDLAGNPFPDNTAQTQFDLQLHTVRIGGNYHFGGGP